MGLITGSRERGSLPVDLLTAAVVFVSYLAESSADGFWGRAGAVVAGTLGETPATSPALLFSRLAAMAPVGPLQLRIALASGICAALATVVLYRAVETTLRCQGVTRNGVVLPLAAGTTWFFASGVSFFTSASQPHTHCFTALLALCAIERAVALEASWPSLDVRPLLSACLALGLAAANDLLMALLIAPALMPSVVRVLRSRKRRDGLPALGLLLLTPGLIWLARSATEAPQQLPMVAMGQASELLLTAAATEPDRLAALATVLWAELGFVAPAALVGAALLMRRGGLKRVGYVWVCAAVVPVFVWGWLGLGSDADSVTRLAPSLAAACVLATSVLGELISSQAQGRLSVALAGLAAILGLTQLATTHSEAGLRDFHAIDVLDGPARRQLPPRAVIASYDTKAAMRHWGAQAADRCRPDLAWVPIDLLARGNTSEQMVAEAPELRSLLRAQLLNGDLSQAALQTLAAHRPVLIDVGSRVSPSLYESLIPAGVFHQVLPGGATSADERPAGRAQLAAYEKLYAALGDAPLRADTRAVLCLRHQGDALYYMGFGDLEAASDSLKLARNLGSEAPVLAAMEAALEGANKQTKGNTALDVAPFLTF